MDFLYHDLLLRLIDVAGSQIQVRGHLNLLHSGDRVVPEPSKDSDYGS